MMRQILALLSLLWLVACAQADNQKIEFTDISYNPYYVIKSGINHDSNITPLSQDFVFWRLQATVYRKTHAVYYSIWAEEHYIGFNRYYVFATDQKGKTLTVIPIYHAGEDCGLQVSSAQCPHRERVGIPLSESDLRDAQDAGYSVRLASKSGYRSELSFSPKIIRKLFAAVEEYIRTHPLEPETRNQEPES